MSNIIKHTSDIFELDSLQYAQGFNYDKSVYQRVKFAELEGMNLFDIVQTPLRNSSDETKREINDIAKITQNRTPKEIELVHKVDSDPLLLYHPVIDRLNMVLDLKAFNTMYYHSLSEMVDHLKFYYNRPRPYQLADMLSVNINRIITKTHKTPSYPSGHTMYAALASEMLSDKYPQHKAELDELSIMTGHARVLQGVHYPSDNIASIKIVNKIFPNIKKYFMEQD